MCASGSKPTKLQSICATALEEIDHLLQARENISAPLIIGIDGRCGSGKTTLAQKLAEGLGCSVIHMDEFFLRPHMRTPERLAQPGGNVDKERLYEEVMKPLKEGAPFSYRPFDCHTGALTTAIEVPQSSIYIIEGTYSLCPELGKCYDLRVFLTVSPEKQLERIEKRNGAAVLEIFKSRWIPLEEAYFKAFKPWEDSHLVFDTSFS